MSDGYGKHAWPEDRPPPFSGGGLIDQGVVSMSFAKPDTMAACSLHGTLKCCVTGVTGNFSGHQKIIKVRLGSAVKHITESEQLCLSLIPQWCRGSTSQSLLLLVGLLFTWRELQSSLQPSRALDQATVHVSDVCATSC